MEKSGFFNAMKVGDSWDRVYKAENFAEYFATFIGNGVFPNPATNLQVVSNNNDMTIILKAGRGWINGFIYINTDDLILNVDVADGVLNRIDRVVLKYDVVNREIRASVKKGAFASSPVAQVLQRDADAYELGIADICIKAGSIGIAQADITDLRLNKDLCGIVHGTVNQVDTTAIFDQYLDWLNTKKSIYDTDFTTWTNAKKKTYEDWYSSMTTSEQNQVDAIKSQFQNDFNTWFQNVKTVLSGDAAGNLYNMITAIPKVFTGTEEPTDIKTGDIWLKEVT
ncbi:hypothetical protein [Clostridium sp. 001]|uniref:hypothetical protein n=1 Tax=Clostridium sp. 001 TaxID=1970093 RepID=UPI001C2C2EF5|nr:hypothetical protein [Clostridium sp. 001]QXE20004.1 hypothetical protein B5S50_14890 [Clostridium sp. 001]